VEWLLRYARNRGLALQHPLGPAHALRAQFSVPAWRLLCRSGRDPFLPITSNRRFDFVDLRAYVEKLIDRGWQVAPAAHLVQHVVDQTYLYLDEPPDAPINDRDLTLVRIAERAGAVSRHQFAQVLEWVIREKPPVGERRSWHRMVGDAALWRQEMTVRLRSESFTAWEFAIDKYDTSDFGFVALKTPADLWVEGVAMSHCVYAIRRYCGHPKPSRFFSMRRGERRVATVELQPEKGGAGWFVRDVRLSFNRLPGRDVIGAAELLARAYTEAAEQWQEAA